MTDLQSKGTCKVDKERQDVEQIDCGIGLLLEANRSFGDFGGSVGPLLLMNKSE